MTDLPAPGHGWHLKQADRDLIEQFLDHFTEVEHLLKKKLRLPANDSTMVTRLVSRYEAESPFWRDDADELRHMADIRNVLTHQRSEQYGYPVIVPRRTADRLRAARDRLADPVPVGRRNRPDVVRISPDDTLEHVLALAIEQDFSQFPVVKDGRFSGLVTENGVTRWLGHQARAGRPQFDLRTVSVRTVLKEEEPERKRRAFEFQPLDAPEYEVMGLFLVHPELEVVLLTACGSRRSPIEGIITQWDAARYPD